MPFHTITANRQPVVKYYPQSDYDNVYDMIPIKIKRTGQREYA